MRALRRVAWILGVVAYLGAAYALPGKEANASGAVAFYGRNGTYQTSQVGSAGWHGSSYGEDALDLFVGQNSTMYFRLDSFARYVYYELSYYGTEGGGSSTCTGRVYTLWWWDPDASTWRYLIRDNFVHLKSMRSSSYGQVSPYSTFEEWVGIVADTQSCSYDPYHLHFSRTLGVGTNAHNGASGFGDPGSWVGSSEVVFIGCD